MRYHLFSIEIEDGTNSLKKMHCAAKGDGPSSSCRSYLHDRVAGFERLNHRYSLLEAQYVLVLRIWSPLEYQKVSIRQTKFADTYWGV